MSRTIRVKRGDLLPHIEVDLSYEDDDLDLTTVISESTAVVFTMRRRGGTEPVIDRADAEVVSATAGVVRARYPWAEGDTDTAGDYEGEFEFTVSGKPLTAPTNGFINVRIGEDLA